MMAEPSDDLMKAMFGNPNHNKQVALRNDFAFSAAASLITIEAMRSGHPREFVETFITEWSRRLMATVAESAKKRDALKADPMGKLLGGVLEDGEAMRIDVKKQVDEFANKMRGYFNTAFDRYDETSGPSKPFD